MARTVTTRRGFSVDRVNDDRDGESFDMSRTKVIYHAAVRGSRRKIESATCAQRPPSARVGMREAGASVTRAHRLITAGEREKGPRIRAGSSRGECPPNSVSRQLHESARWPMSVTFCVNVMYRAPSARRAKRAERILDCWPLPFPAVRPSVKLEHASRKSFAVSARSNCRNME